MKSTLRQFKTEWKVSTTSLIGLQECVEEEARLKCYFNKIMKKNFPNFEKLGRTKI